MDRRLLASAGPGTLFRGFPGSRPNVWYPVALAEAIAGAPLNDDNDPDIRINANSTANWYFETDGNTPRNRIDLVSVILHELGHGLGFLSSVDTVGTDQLAIGFGGRFIVYDLFLEAGAVPLAGGMFGNPSAELLRAVTRDDLFFNGPLATREFGEEVPMFSPAEFDNGSSVSHLSEAEFRPGTENALMTPFLSAGEAVHDPGPVTLGIFADMGWDAEFDLGTSTIDPGNTRPLIFPNPAREQVFIRSPAVSGVTALELYAADGRRLRNVAAPGGSDQHTLNLSGLTPGFYVLVVHGRQVSRHSLVIR